MAEYVVSSLTVVFLCAVAVLAYSLWVGRQ